MNRWVPALLLRGFRIVGRFNCCRVATLFLVLAFCAAAGAVGNFFVGLLLLVVLGVFLFAGEDEEPVSALLGLPFRLVFVFELEAGESVLRGRPGLLCFGRSLSLSKLFFGA